MIVPSPKETPVPTREVLPNPFRPGAGHVPPHLAGRRDEMREFRELLRQEVITQNVVLTGLRGVGKTVLMDTEYKRIAAEEKWVWVGADLSESVFVDELTLCNRLLTDLSLFTSRLDLPGTALLGFTPKATSKSLDYAFLLEFFHAQPGLVVDKLKATLEFVWKGVQTVGLRGVVFAYDEAQVVQDRRDKDQYPLALLLEAFQSLQKKGVRFMLLLTGLPTLFPKLVESRTYAERMFKVQEIGKLSREASADAINKPLEGSPRRFTRESVRTIVEISGGYPYFIQFICRDAFDFYAGNPVRGPVSAIPIDTIVRKLDADFFAGRWSRLPDRQRDLLFCIAGLRDCDSEFTIGEVATISRSLSGVIRKSFRTGDISQMIPRLIESGLVYKNRHGKYSFAVPLFGKFIQRQYG